MLRSPLEHWKNDKQSSGFALVAVLGFMLTVSAILTPFSVSARMRTIVAENTFEQYRYSQLTEFLSFEIAQNLAALLKSGEVSPSQLSGRTACGIGEFTVVVGLQDHGGLIDINTTGVGLLVAGFQSLGFSEKDAQQISLAVDVYRRRDRSSRPNLQPDLTAHGGYKHQAFEDVVELQDFPILQRLLPIEIANTFTVYTQRGTISSGLAPAHLRSVLSPEGNRTASALPPTEVITLLVEVFRGGKSEFVSARTFKLSGETVSFSSAVPVTESVAPKNYNQHLGPPCHQLVRQWLLVTAVSMLP